jgi:hypothetical protein
MTADQKSPIEIRRAVMDGLSHDERKEECFHHLARVVDEVVSTGRRVMQDYRDTGGKLFGYTPRTYLLKTDFSAWAEERIVPAIHGLRLNGETSVVDQLEQKFFIFQQAWRFLKAGMPSAKPAKRSANKALCDETADAIDAVLDRLEEAAREALRHFGAECQIKGWKAKQGGADGSSAHSYTEFVYELSPPH